MLPGCLGLKDSNSREEFLKGTILFLRRIFPSCIMISNYFEIFIQYDINDFSPKNINKKFLEVLGLLQGREGRVIEDIEGTVGGCCCILWGGFFGGNLESGLILYSIFFLNCG